MHTKLMNRRSLILLCSLCTVKYGDTMYRPEMLTGLVVERLQYGNVREAFPSYWHLKPVLEKSPLDEEDQRFLP